MFFFYTNTKEPIESVINGKNNTF